MGEEGGGDGGKMGLEGGVGLEGEGTKEGGMDGGANEGKGGGKESEGTSEVGEGDGVEKKEVTKDDKDNDSDSVPKNVNGDVKGDGDEDERVACGEEKGVEAKEAEEAEEKETKEQEPKARDVEMKAEREAEKEKGQEKGQEKRKEAEKEKEKKKIRRLGLRQDLTLDPLWSGVANYSGCHLTDDELIDIIVPHIPDAAGLHTLILSGNRFLTAECLYNALPPVSYNG